MSVESICVCNRPWTDNDGNQRMSLDVRDFTFLGYAVRGQYNGDATAQPSRGVW